MEQSNVNNLNGVPNFGHGFPEDISEETKDDIAEAEEATDEPKKRGRKLSSQ